MTDSATIAASPTDDGVAWWQVLLAGVMHASLWYLVFPSPGGWWLAFLVPVPLVWAAVRARRRRTLVWALGLPVFGAWLAHQWWVGAVSGLGLLPMCLVLAAWTPMLALAIRRLARSPRLGGLPLAVLVPLAWVLIEELRAEVAFDGYPWYLLGQPLVEWPLLAQVADLGGVLLVAVLPASIAGTLCDHLLRRGTVVCRRRASIGVALLTCGWLAYGGWRVSTVSARPGPTVLALQTNLPQSNKVGWAPEAQWRDANAFATRTVDAFRAAEQAGETIDLVAWPETMLPGVGLEPASTRFMTAQGWWPGDRLARLAVELQAIVDRPLLLGSGSFEGLRLGEDGESLDWDARFNSVYLLDGRGVGEAIRYDKMFLTPFGETMPYISSWPWLETQLLDFGARGMRFDLVPGRDPVRFEFVRRPRGGDASRGGEVVRIATPICFEDTVPAVCRRLVFENGEKVADLLLNASNDGWFGSHDGARGMHLQLARFRCIENRVPMIRSVNTGYSASIDSVGRLIETLPSQLEGELVSSVVLDERRPPVAWLGRGPVVLVSLVAAGLLLVAGGGARGGGGVETTPVVE